MVATAKEKLEELGLIDSLERRHAKETDLNISDILYTDKSSAVKDVFGEMQKEVLINPRTLSKVEEVSAEDFNVQKGSLPANQSNYLWKMGTFQTL